MTNQNCAASPDSADSLDLNCDVIHDIIHDIIGLPADSPETFGFFTLLFFVLRGGVRGTAESETCWSVPEFHVS